MRIHLIDQNSPYVRILEGFFQGAGFEVESSAYAHGQKLEEPASPCDVIVLCTGNAQTGLEAVQAVRGALSLPLLVISSDGAQFSSTLLDKGADDCLPWPCDTDELIARLKSLARRRQETLFAHTSLICEDVEMDLSSGSVNAGSTIIPLTKTEYRLLYQLLLHKKEIVPKSKLQACLKKGDSKTSAQLVDVHVANLRRKIGDLVTIEAISRKGVRLGT